MARRDEILAYADELLEVHRFPEFGPPGLQVVGAEEVTKLACGVSASVELFERAAAAGAQLVLVHHGLFWRNEPLVVDRRQRGRLEALFRADLSLAAYHLALDAHPEIGNNAQLAAALGIERERAFGEIGLGGRLARALQDRRVRRACAASSTASRSSSPTARSDRACRDHDRRGRRRPDPGRARGLRPLPHRRARGAEPAHRRASSASTSSPPATTRPSVSASRRSRRASPIEFGVEWEFLEVENPVWLQGLPHPHRLLDVARATGRALARPRCRPRR